MGKFKLTYFVNCTSLNVSVIARFRLILVEFNWAYLVEIVYILNLSVAKPIFYLFIQNSTVDYILARYRWARLCFCPWIGGRRMQRIIGGLGAWGGRHRLHVRRQSIARTASRTHSFPFISVLEAGGGAAHVQRSAAEPAWIRLRYSLKFCLDLPFFTQMAS